MPRIPQLAHRLFLAFLVAVGIELTWAVVSSVTFDSVPREPVAVSADGSPVRTARGILIQYPAEIMVQSDGTVLVSREAWGTTKGAARLYTLDLQPLQPTGSERWIAAADLGEALGPGDGPGRLTPQERLTDLWTGNSLGQNWYFVHDSQIVGSGYFVGFDTQSKLSLGYIGKQGPSQDVPRREDCFGVDGRSLRRVNHVLLRRQDRSTFYGNGISIKDATAYWPESVVFLAAGGQLWKIDLTKRTAESLAQGDGVIDLDAAPAPRENETRLAAGESDTAMSRLLVRTRTAVTLMDLDGKQERVWPIPTELQGQALRWFVLDDGGAIAESFHRQGDGPYWTQTRLSWINRKGEITRQESFELASGRREESPGWTAAALSLGPALMTFALAADYWDRNSPAESLSYLIADNWGALIVVIAGSAVLAGLAYRRHSRYALAGSAAWATFVFLLGVPGWLAYRWHRRWPVLDACGDCHRSAPRDRESCTHCGRAFAPPALLGTEVLA
ncbi:MAG TPA: hypothetical protein VHC22_14920 [Pirellulales bacterium]|nr:hypothetical protein [Pirellulales bacterium]